MMLFAYALATALAVTLGMTVPVTDGVAIRATVEARSAGEYHVVHLPEPFNWSAGPSLFPQSVLAGFHGTLEKYNFEDWSDHVLRECKKYKTCTSCIGYAADNSGSTGGRYWFGFAFSGGPTTVANYTRTTKYNLSHSRAYSI